MTIYAARGRLKASVTMLEMVSMPASLRARHRELVNAMRALDERLRDLMNDAGAELRAEAAREFEARHTAACRRHLEDLGATCICRPPAGGDT